MGGQSVGKSRTPGPRAQGDRSAAAFAVIDFETSGFSPKADRAVEMAIVLTDMRGDVVHEWDTLLNPGGSVGATRVHHITQSDVADAPSFEEVAETVVGLLHGAAIVAHNASFDLPFLRAELEAASWQVPDIESVTLCTYRASSFYLPDLDRRTLADCCAAVGVEIDGAHTALGDTRATAKLLAAYLAPDVPPAPRPADLALPAAARALGWQRALW